MSNLVSSSGAARDLWGPATVPAGPPAPTAPGPATSSPADAAASYGDALEQLPTPPVASAALISRLDPTAAKLDELMAASKGPYRVDGAVVFAPTQFRMSGGFNDGRAAPGTRDGRALATAATKAGVVAELPMLQVGRGPAAALTKLTQALIDAGELARGPTPAAERIHQLQWRFGIGVDCAGYVYAGLAAIHGDLSKLGLRPTGFENFTGLKANARFAEVGPTAARAGDVLVLRGSGGSDPGHNLLVRSSGLLRGATSALARFSGAAALDDGTEHVHAIEVDSSFGAGANGARDGGVRRDLLVYDDRTGAWSTLRNTPDRAAETGAVPYGEVAVTGLFRATVTP